MYLKHKLNFIAEGLNYFSLKLIFIYILGEYVTSTDLMEQITDLIHYVPIKLKFIINILLFLLCKCYCNPNQ